MELLGISGSENLIACNHPLQIVSWDTVQMAGGDTLRHRWPILRLVAGLGQ